ncbi:hypothetical protein [Ancylobacter polymorphus]|uniref:Uncharacterized protein n=1 Tax=Ancylobacter polymorphus TaxID=223390 RepID=A0A9E7A6V2_9HYPH|nr:hypothetical protein [Ancylobacter polymorphus]UOK71884.1 hypothetical protein K9D25_03960 [Ancylobacter polymorphus]
MAENAFYATGYGGQIIAVVPAKWLVAGQAVDLKRNSKGVVESVSNQRLKLKIWRWRQSPPNLSPTNSLIVSEKQANSFVRPAVASDPANKCPVLSRLAWRRLRRRRQISSGNRERVTHKQGNRQLLRGIRLSLSRIELLFAGI